ncbi:MAG: hypothetical protein ABI035_10580, partial [Gemmatimonadaceae bacterium]
SFFFLSAASGIVGNLAYDALKVLIKRLRRTDDGSFEKTITVESYESIRIRAHSSSALGQSESAEVERTIERRYAMIAADADQRRVEMGQTNRGSSAI